MIAKVVNIKNEKWDIYIGWDRSNQCHWGNPFVIGKDGDRQEVIDKFKFWFYEIAYQDIEPERLKWMHRNLYRLKGKKLGCFCKPEACHGDILLEEANK